ncbi:MAG: PadR family transcriptional regulator [Acidobacteriota bacterium]
MPQPFGQTLSAADFHVLLVLCEGDLYGYAILKAVEEESRGRVRPDLGALYRALARLGSAGLVQPVPPPPSAEKRPGKPRRYYGITPAGRRILGQEVKRMQEALVLAERRLGLQETP